MYSNYLQFPVSSFPYLWLKIGCVTFVTAAVAAANSVFGVIFTSVIATLLIMTHVKKTPYLFSDIYVVTIL